MSFLLGYLCGIATLLVYAWHLSRSTSSKAEAKPGVAAVGVTSRWIDNDSDDEADALKCARIDIQDLDAADTVIALGDVPRSNASRGGHHFEAGYALASGHRILLVGHREHVFSHLPEIEFFPTWHECLTTLKAEQFRKPGRLAA